MYYRNALGLRPSPHLCRLSSLDSLTRRLYARFRHTGIISDLDEGISLLGDAVPSLASRPRLVWTLSVMLASRFNLSGRPEDLEEAMMRYANCTKTIDGLGGNAV